MKKYCLVTLCFLCCCGGYAAVGQGRPVDTANAPAMEQPTWEELELRGAVQKVVAVQRYASGHDMNSQEEWEFDENGKLQRYTKSGFGGHHTTEYPRPIEPDKRQKATYDEDGDILELRRYAANRQLLSSSHYIYAAGGTLAATVTYSYEAGNDNAVASRTETYFDKEGRRVSVEQYTADEVLQMEEHYKYNCHGDLAKRTQTFYNGTEKEITREQHKYKYDHYGNWVRSTYVNNGKTYYTTTRTITYYK